MDKSKAMAPFAVRSPSEISYPSPERLQRRIRFIVHRLIPGALVLIAVGATVTTVYVVLIGLDWTIMPLAIGLAFAGFCVLLPAAYWLESAPIDVRDGMLTFPYRMRRRDGSKTNRLSLDEVVRASAVIELHDVPNPNVPVTRAAMGLTLDLADGTAVFLAQSRFGAHGLDVLQKIGNLHGVSYLDQTIDLLRGPRYPRLHVWGVRGFRDNAIELSKKMRTYTSGPTKVLRPQDVRFVESITTDFAGRGYVFVRTDGLFLFLQGEKLDQYRVWSAQEWADKLVD